MGQGVSKWDVIDWSVNRNQSDEHRISAWAELEPKNVDYYSGKRFFKVSRKHYPGYTPGYWYGYDESSLADYWFDTLSPAQEEN